MKLSAFTVLVPDYDAGIRFFCGILGFELCEDLNQGRKRWVTVCAPGGGVQIVLARADTPEQRAATGRQVGGRVWLFPETDDFERDHARLIREGIRFDEEPRDEPYGRVADFLPIPLATAGI
ncbi:VOC family protein [uncultured Roseobacter sp.]|uniref:VOC family protein n=1 Tax=uncultured Roseobacter sp. TaxID=114847 RepID=UPI00345A07AB